MKHLSNKIPTVADHSNPDMYLEESLSETIAAGAMMPITIQNTWSFYFKFVIVMINCALCLEFCKFIFDSI